MENYYINLGNLIKEKRLKMGLTTQQLANILGVSIGSLSNLENAKTDTFNVDLILKLYNNLDISLFDFLPISNSNLHSGNLLSPSQLSETPNNKVDMLSLNIDVIVNTYINSIKNHNYEPLFIDKLTSKLIQELTYIDDFKLK